MMKYVPELGYELQGRALSLWDGTATDKTADQCEAYRRMMLLRPKPGTTTAKPSNGHIANVTAKLSCMHLGEPTGELKQCQTCSGTVKLKILKCSVHGECTIEKKLDGKACCNGCPDYSPKDKPAEVIQLSPPAPRVFPSITYHYPHVVYHVAEMGDWQEVVCEQLAALKEAGLEEVRVSIAGGPGAWVVAEAASRGVRATIIAETSNLKSYESGAMNEIARLASESDRPILYLHTKGVSAPNNHGKRLWRRVMMRHLVAKWREYWPDLNAYDAIGCNWMPSHRAGNELCPHFAGNFWLARADHIRSLVPWEQWWRRRGKERFSCESWIGSRAGVRALSLLTSDAGWGNDAVENFTPFLE